MFCGVIPFSQADPDPSGTGSNMAGQSNDTALLQLWQHFGRHGARRFEVPHWGSRRRRAKRSYYVLE